MPWSVGASYQTRQLALDLNRMNLTGPTFLDKETESHTRLHYF